jgi:serine/threonine-protein kinase
MGAAEKQLIAGRYELEALIGEGGSAEVWRARHLGLNSLVALKLLHATTSQHEWARRRFTTEAQVTAQLRSRYAVQVFDVGVTDDGHPYIVMELLDGEDLRSRIDRVGRIALVDAGRILSQCARALHRAHQLGIVHRDFKPDNVIISSDEDGRDLAKVVDFGIAKLVGELDSAPGEPFAPSDTATAFTTFTNTGAILGTPVYMAPEQIRNAAEVDFRTDIWAFGIVAYECLVGARPFDGKNLIELFQKISSGDHPRPHTIHPNIPAKFSEWFEVACAPEPARRFSSASVACRALLASLDLLRSRHDSTFPARTSSTSMLAVVVPPSDHAGATAATVHGGDDVGRPPPGRIALTPAPSDPRAFARTVADDRAEPSGPAASLPAPAQRRAPRHRWWVGSLVGVVGAVSLVGWLAASRAGGVDPSAAPSALATNAPAADRQTSPPSTAPSPTEPASVSAPPAASPSASTPPSVVRPPPTKPSTVPKPTRDVAATSSLQSPPSPAPASAPVPAAAPQPPAATTPVDPYNYR